METMETLEQGTRVLRQAVMGVVWRQWRALGWTGSARAAAAQVDPEALLLVSLGLVDRERALADVLNWWAVAGARLMSLQRTKNLVDMYAEPVRFRLREFAAHARDGGDFRWRSLAGGARGTRPSGPEGGEPAVPQAPAALALRLRLGLGVGVKADVVSYLLGVEGAWSSVRTLSRATSYAGRSVRRGAEELVRAGLLHASGTTPVEYQVDAEPWLRLLGMREAPRWRPWRDAFGLATEVVDVVERDARRDPKWVLQRMTATVARHATTLRRARLALPDAAGGAGGYAEALGELAARLEREA
jgi:hypothetical protein